MKANLILLLLLFIPLNLAAQNTITVDATGEIMIPVDILNLQINITVTGPTPRDVFGEHRSQEEFLAGIIREHGLEGDPLTFQPMRIGAHQTRDGRQFASNQYVNLELHDFTLFNELQVVLIENGFENFQGHFGSTQINEGRNEALDLAISNARDKAARIAMNIGKVLGEIISIEHTAHRVMQDQGMQLAEMRTFTGMTGMDQKIPATASVRIVYHIAD